MNPTRSPRVLAHLKEAKSTPESVGPLEYSRHDLVSSRGSVGLSKKDVKASSTGSLVAFQSRVANDKYAQISSMRTPGPGTYGRADSSEGQLRGGSRSLSIKSSMTRSTASAFRSQRDSSDGKPTAAFAPGSKGAVSSGPATPGPGQYDPSLVSAKGAEPRGSGSVHNSTRLSKIGVVNSSPASIPSPRLEAKELMRYSGTQSDSLGPGDYEIKDGSSKIRNREVDFHQYTSERVVYSLSNNPGPGRYNIRTRLTKGTTSPFASGAERPVNKEDDDTGTPGPGTYKVVERNSITTDDNRDGEVLPHASLRSTTERTGWYRPALENPYKDAYWIHNVPGPGFYNTERHRSSFPPKVMRRVRSQADALNNLTFHGVHHPQQVMLLKGNGAMPLCGFGSMSERDVLKQEDEQDATPAAYSTEAMSIAASVRERSKVGKKGAFGSLAPRVGPAEPLPLGTGDDVGPGHYGVPQPVKGKLITGSAFASKVERFKDPIESPFGKYDVDHVPNYRNKLRRIRSEHLSFGSSKDRWDPKEVFIGQAFHLSPGPGEYMPKVDAGKALSIMTTEDRNLEPKKEKDVTGGPGPHLTHGSLIKKTYNMLSPEEAEIRAKDRESGLVDVSSLVGGAGGGAAGQKARLALTDAVIRSKSDY
mmetsp:Transcript_6086/g.13493  ORF Transcript_6086/g.13493 Transcript_6086/m.13493 type:complete len:647 (-) Transcript_6086:11-1951(-)